MTTICPSCGLVGPMTQREVLQAGGKLVRAAAVLRDARAMSESETRHVVLSAKEEYEAFGCTTLRELSKLMPELSSELVTAYLRFSRFYRLYA